MDLSRVRGTGRKGRILAEDVRRHVKEVMTALGPAAREEAPGVPAPGLPGGLPPIPEVDFSRFGPVEQRPLSRIKRRSGPNLHRAWLSVPLVTHFDEADITELEAFRRSLADDGELEGVRVTLLAFVMKALVAALKQYPTFNASLAPDGQSLIVKGYYNIGIAVDTPNGLVVPVLSEVDRKSIRTLAAEMGEVSARAREGKLRPSDLEGGCMSISSLGGIGGRGFTPLVNPPDVAILGVARAHMAPVWDGKSFVPRLMLPLCLSYDHRVIDGAEGARFTATLVRLLGDVRRLLL